ncbi:tetratricopeptide repeat protein [Psychroserpens sp. MEBiC05023]
MRNTCITAIIIIFFQFGFSQTNSPYQAYYNNENYEAVIKIAQEQLKSNPKDSMANYFLGFSYANLKEYKKAIKNLEIAKKSGLKGPAVLLRLAEGYTAQNLKEKAIAELTALDEQQFGFYNRLDQPIFDAIRSDERFKTIRENMYKRANPCKFDDNYRAFDFWVGEWDVYSQNQKIAESSITNSNGLCGIIENWKPIGSNGGHSISYYDPLDKKWKQNWVAGGNVSHYEQPTIETDGDMLLIAKAPKIWFRMTWYYNKEDDTVRQVQESSSDEGKHWTIAFDGLYKRKQE